MISARTIALGPLVSLLFIFHVLCCLPSCDSANQFFAHYSISYDSNKVTLHSLNTACVRDLLVSSYIKFCTRCSNPPGLGRIFADMVPFKEIRRAEVQGEFPKWKDGLRGRASFERVRAR